MKYKYISGKMISRQKYVNTEMSEFMRIAKEGKYIPKRNGYPLLSLFKLQDMAKIVTVLNHNRLLSDMEQNNRIM